MAPLQQRAEAGREDLPACWVGDARDIPGAFSFGDGVRPWNWLELDGEDAQKVWSFVAGFVDFFNARYAPRADHRIPACWAEHGPLVEEVTTLAFARWQAFASAHASIGGAQYWHSYTLPGFLSRLQEWLGSHRRSCQYGEHRDPYPVPSRSARRDVLREGLISRDVAVREQVNASGQEGLIDASVPRIEIPFLRSQAIANSTEGSVG